MPAQDSQGRYIQPEETITGGALASAARTTSTSGTAFATDDFISLTATLNVTDRDGTSPTLDVELQTSGDAGSTYEKVAQFTQVSTGVPAITHATTTEGDDSPTVNEIQTVTITNADGGTFTLTYSGQTTTAIPYGSSAAVVDAALEALSNIGAGDVSVVKASDVYTITFAGAMAATDVAQLTSDGALLTATDLTPEVMVFGPVGAMSRWAWTIGGSNTPTFTFSVTPVTGNKDN
jgi:hypothetical protein